MHIKDFLDSLTNINTEYKSKFFTIRGIWPGVLVFTTNMKTGSVPSIINNNNHTFAYTPFSATSLNILNHKRIKHSLLTHAHTQRTLTTRRTQRTRRTLHAGFMTARRLTSSPHTAVLWRQTKPLEQPLIIRVWNSSAHAHLSSFMAAIH